MQRNAEQHAKSAWKEKVAISNQQHHHLHVAQQMVFVESWATSQIMCPLDMMNTH
jgi:hypothetical protein